MGEGVPVEVLWEAIETAVGSRDRLRAAVDGVAEMIRVLQHDGRLTDLGEAVAHYGRIFKTLHVLTFADDSDYRRHTFALPDLGGARRPLRDPNTVEE